MHEHTPYTGRMAIQKHFFTFFANVKKRWINQPLVSVLSSEFQSEKEDYYASAIEVGAIKVNNEIVSPGYLLKECDKITHLVHLHELECPKIEVIAEDHGLVAVNKPAGIPCHPTSRYRKYCVLNALGHTDLRCLHRLDIVTSGVLLLATHQCRKSLKDATKVYMARVRGDFPEKITVDKRILVLPGISMISDDGKDACTYFRKISYKNGHSLVECTLKTGRSHQIRVHLKSIGFPIVNDFLYGREELPERIYEVCDENPVGLNKVEEFVIKNCRGRNLQYSGNRSFICLHSYKYILENIVYTAELPGWASLESIQES